MTDRSARLFEAAHGAVAAQEHAVLLKDKGRLRWVADDYDCPDIMRLAALTEELGEVARSIHEDNRQDLVRELHQLAGIALAWSAYLAEPSLV